MRGPFKRYSEKKAKAAKADRQAFDSIKYAALNEISDKLQSRGIIGSLNKVKVSQEIVNSYRDLIQEYREWLKTQTNTDIVKAYNFWLGGFEKDTNQAQAILDARKRVSALPKPNL